MIYHVEKKDSGNVIALSSEIIYLQKPYWCACSSRSLSLSLIAPRQYFSYDPVSSSFPCLVFFCGGAFQKQDRGVWIPELVYFAKHGYIVATVDYSTLPYTEFPEPLVEAKNAVRFLRAHAAEFHIDKNHIAAMGESAGGQIAIWMGVTNGDSQYDQGTYLEESSAVQCCVAWYPVTNISLVPTPQNQRIYMGNFPDSCALINEHTPACILLHGTGDSQVPYSQSTQFHECMTRLGKSCELYLFEDAEHSDPAFYNDSSMQLVLNFLDRELRGL